MLTTKIGCKWIIEYNSIEDEQKIEDTVLKYLEGIDRNLNPLTYDSPINHMKKGDMIVGLFNDFIMIIPREIKGVILN